MILKHIGNSLAVQLAIVKYVHLLHAHVFSPFRSHKSLQIIRGHHAEKINLARGSINLWLIGLAFARLGQPGICGRGTNHEQPSLVQHWHADLARSGIKSSDVRNHILITRRLIRVLRFNSGIPITALRTGVVHVFVHNGVVANFSMNFINGQLNSVDHGGGLRVGAARAWQTGNDFQYLLWLFGLRQRWRDCECKKKYSGDFFQHDGFLFKCAEEV